MQIINREAKETNQGFRYQKLRAAMHILEAVESADDFYFAIEYLDDIYGAQYSASEKNEILEQDKYYDETTTFTFSSEQIYKSIINFLDNWLNKGIPSNVNFLICSTNSIGKEKSTAELKKSNITLPQTPILKLLMSRAYENDENLLEEIKKLILHFYFKEYSSKQFTGFITTIESFSAKDWINFLGKINYFFEQDNIDELKNQIVDKIINCKLFDASKLKGKEEYILSSIIDQLDERQGKDWPANFLSRSDIRLIFSDLSIQEPFKLEDPSWSSWDNEMVEDSRGIEEKIKAVCENFSTKKFNSIKRRLASAILEQQNSQQNLFLAQKYRVYEECEEILIEKIKIIKEQNLTENDINNIIDELCEKAHFALNQWGKTYHYPYNNTKTIKGIILNLFNECYLAFDEDDNQ